MSVMIVTSLGEIVVDLHVDRCPLACKNFLKLCKIKYYNGCLFHTVQKDFTAQTGDPTGTGSGGDSIYKFLYGEQARCFNDEIHLDLKHSKIGTVAMASAGKDLNASQFYITLRDNLDYLDGKHTVFGEVAEGLETLLRINDAYVDEKGRPYKNIRIKHTYILDDPFDDPEQLAELIPDASPEGKPKDEVDDEVRLEDDWVPMDEQLAPGELEEVIREKEAHSRAVVLESIGDIPDADIKPPENVLFVCKLNHVTEDEDLHTIFSRFGTVISADIIRDHKTGESLNYAFIEFEDVLACQEAYKKMDNALIDDRRIHVDFSQSVAKKWADFRRGKAGQMGKGKGCFKCGSLDHIQRDCNGSPSAKQQGTEYVLKDKKSSGNVGENGKRYEMVFDEDAAGSSGRKRRQRSHEAQDHVNQREMDREGYKKKDYRNRDSSYKQSGGSKSEREDDRYRKSRTSPSRGRDKDDSIRDNRDFRSGDDDRHRSRRDDAELSKRNSNRDSVGNRRDDRDSKRSAEYSEGRRRDRDEYYKGKERDHANDSRRDRDESRNKELEFDNVRVHKRSSEGSGRAIGSPRDSKRYREHPSRH